MHVKTNLCESALAQLHFSCIDKHLAHANSSQHHQAAGTSIIGFVYEHLSAKLRIVCISVDLVFK